MNRRRVPGLLHHYHTKTGMWASGRYQLVGGGAEEEEGNKDLNPRPQLVKDLNNDEENLEHHVRNIRVNNAL